MSRNNSLTIRLHEDDNVVVALSELKPGTELPEEGVAAAGRIPSGHKVAMGVIPRVGFPGRGGSWGTLGSGLRLAPHILPLLQ